MSFDTIRRSPFTWLGVAVAAAAIIAIWAFYPTQEKQVRHVILELARIVEKKDFTALPDYLSPKYRGEYFSSRDEVMQHVEKDLREISELSIPIKFAEIHVAGDQANTLILFHISGTIQRMKFQGFQERNPLRPEKVYVEFLKTGDRWQMQFFTWSVDQYLPQFPKAQKKLP